MDRLNRGKDAENHALQFLKRHGLKPLTRNYRCRQGEIDLIMLDRATLVFIEVRARQHQAWGGASASVDRRKQHKIQVTAQHFLGHHPEFQHAACRFDVVAYEGCFSASSTGKAGDSSPVWYKDAFRPEATF